MKPTLLHLALFNVDLNKTLQSDRPPQKSDNGYFGTKQQHLILTAAHVFFCVGCLIDFDGEPRSRWIRTHPMIQDSAKRPGSLGPLAPFLPGASLSGGSLVQLCLLQCWPGYLETLHEGRNSDVSWWIWAGNSSRDGVGEGQHFEKFLCCWIDVRVWGQKSYLHSRKLQNRFEVGRRVGYSNCLRASRWQSYCRLLAIRYKYPSNNFKFVDCLHQRSQLHGPSKPPLHLHGITTYPVLAGWSTQRILIYIQSPVHMKHPIVWSQHPRLNLGFCGFLIFRERNGMNRYA